MERVEVKRSDRITKYLLWSTIGVLVTSVISMFAYPDITILLIVAFFLLGFITFNRLKDEVARDIDQAEQQIKQIHSSVKNYTPTQTVYLENYTSLLSIDENNKKICIINNNKPEILNFSDILQSELIEDEVSITKVSRGSQIVGIAAGSLIGGATGAIVGALSGSTQTTQSVSKIKLQITVNSISNPIREFYFLNKPVAIKKENQEYRDVFEEANCWHKAMCVIINQLDRGIL